ncbi:MAG TPA: DUF2244 domain-containing protein [Paracoccus sp. (in: a-proteobacteria)]|uniref:DUF2244 domain-containing protein n=1 Tax=uncultured Paracoccus sp. TaxID=189685 RepID=UPI002623333C|nr:DUF2244 domain-containing protein [uncultured Paracoccus sp.]HMQ42220.1 DUF2244 domain-containing protein [Paracoccus sp. (in: a-proteobacteria)]HMR37263.1 DUF2244 domain-containing protein [Paracoccus sp. (in: a-proteobacteria)]
MPYEWQTDGDMRRLRAWPFRSLPRRGFVWFIGVTAVLLALPLLAVLGSAVLWALLPFMLAAIAGIWWAIERSYRSGTSEERLELTATRISLIRRDPGRPERSWSANPYWIRAVIRPGPVEKYLVLQGDHESGREIELGAFLTPEERESLATEINSALSGLRRSH